MDRNAALDYLSREYSKPANELGVPATDTGDGWQNAIDAAFLSLSVPYTALTSATVDSDTDAPLLIALLNYYGVRRLLRAASTRVDLQIGRPAQLANRSQLFKQLQALLDDAQLELVQLGIGNVPQITLGRFTLDFLEPFLELDSVAP